MTNITLRKIEHDKWKDQALLFGYDINDLDKMTIDYPENMSSPDSFKKDDSIKKQKVMKNLSRHGFGSSER